MFWAEAGGRVVALGDAAPVADVVAGWVDLGLEVTVYAGESLPGRPVDQLVRCLGGVLRRTERGRELVQQAGAAGWREAIEAVGAALA
ncbi:hypothetical protein WMF30_10545 [Sorangium sp. So ce134]